jgi:hypothetical protein
MSTLAISANRAARKYSQGELVFRVMWAFGQWFFRCSPRPCFGWRRFVLRCFGARIGRHVHLYPGFVFCRLLATYEMLNVFKADELRRRAAAHGGE